MPAQIGSSASQDHGRPEHLYKFPYVTTPGHAADRGRDLGSVTGPFPVLTEAPGSERHEDQLPLPGACSRCQRSRKCVEAALQIIRSVPLHGRHSSRLITRRSADTDHQLAAGSATERDVSAGRSRWRSPERHRSA